MAEVEAGVRVRDFVRFYEDRHSYMREIDMASRRKIYPPDLA